MSDKLFHNIADYANEYMDNLQDCRVYPDNSAVRNLSEFDQPIPDHGLESENILNQLRELGGPATVATTSGRYFGFVIGSALPVTIGANWISAVWDQCPGLDILSPIGNKLEKVVSKWLVDLFNLPSSSDCGFVSGATMANFTALATARHHILKKHGWDVEEDGLFGAPEINVVVSAEYHASIEKALALLGLGRSRVTKIPVDDQGRIRADSMPTIDANTILIVQAGNVNTGSFDPFEKILPVANEAGAWIHVDGAFGLWAAATSNYKHLTKGIELADSWTVDLHKWLNVPYDSGVVICKHPNEVIDTMTLNAGYILHRQEREPYMMTQAMSRRARGIDAWAALSYLGRTGTSALIDRCCIFADLFAQKLQQAGHEILNDVVLNQVLVTFGSKEKNLSVMQKLQDEGICWVGDTTWQNQHAIRISVSSWRTTEEDIIVSAEAMIRAANN